MCECGGACTCGRTCNGGKSYTTTSITPPLYGGTRPAANMNGRTNSTPNPNKNYKNWNMCFSCGYDIPSWHTSATCDNRKQGHQTGCTRENAEQYTAVGNYIRRRAIHKGNLPVKPGINQAWQGGAAASLELACNLNTSVNVSRSLYPTHRYDDRTNLFPI